MARLSKIAALGLVGFLTAISVAGIPAHRTDGAQDTRLQNTLQQEELRRQQLLENLKKQELRRSTPAPSATESGLSEKKYSEAQLIYNNLRLEQKLSHEEAISTLTKAGFPIDKISAR